MKSFMQKTILVSLFGFFILASAGAAETKPVYLDPTKPVEARVDDLLTRLTLEEKISLLHADSKFTTTAIPRLGIPRRWLDDGPHGVREDIGPVSYTHLTLPTILRV